MTWQDSRMTAISDLLKRARIRKGLTQEATAHAANISMSTMQRLEAGRVTPTPQTLVALADLLGLSPDDVFTAARLEKPDDRTVRAKQPA